MAHVAVSKYADHLPLYRQEGIFKRFGVELSRSTMCDWMAAAAGLLAPIVKAMLKRVLLSDVVQTDDTPVKVQDHDGKGIKTGRLWVHIGDHNNRFTVYDYTPDRSGDGPARVFKGYEGYLQADAYFGLRRLVRRWHDHRGRVLDARAAEVPRRAKTSDPVRSHLMLAWVAGLYEVEEDAKQARKKHPEWDDAAWHAYRYESAVAAVDVRSWTRSTPGSRRSSPRCCPRARSARRSVIR